MAFDPLYLEPGDLRHSITIQAPSSATDEYGQPVQTWNTILATRAKIQAMTMRDTTQAGQMLSEVTHTITIRYPGAGIVLHPGNRAVHNGQKYTIQAIDNVLLRNRVCKLQCLAIDEAA